MSRRVNVTMSAAGNHEAREGYGHTGTESMGREVFLTPFGTRDLSSAPRHSHGPVGFGVFIHGIKAGGTTTP
jgi:hypothetical protein